MKKVIAIVLITVLTISMVGCKKKTDDDISKPVVDNENTAESDASGNIYADDSILNSTLPTAEELLAKYADNGYRFMIGVNLSDSLDSRNVNTYHYEEEVYNGREVYSQEHMVVDSEKEEGNVTGYLEYYKTNPNGTQTMYKYNAETDNFDISIVDKEIRKFNPVDYIDTIGVSESSVKGMENYYIVNGYMSEEFKTEVLKKLDIEDKYDFGIMYEIDFDKDTLVAADMIFIIVDIGEGSEEIANALTMYARTSSKEIVMPDEEVEELEEEEDDTFEEDDDSLDESNE